MTGKLPCKQCTTTTKNKIIVAEEKRKIIIKNDDQKIVSKILIDKCVIRDDSLRCDVLFEVDDPVSKALYVELKGKDIKHAIEQLENSLYAFQKNHNNVIKECYIICSAVPRAFSSLGPIKVRFKKNFNASLVVRENKFSVAV